MLFDVNDNIYVPDSGNHRVRIIEADTHTLPAPGIAPDHTDNMINTIAGTGVEGAYGDGIPATEAQMRHPAAVAIGPDGNVYIADTFNHCVRMVDENGIITTFAGTMGVRDFGGDGGHPAQAFLDPPVGIAFDSAGNFYIADMGTDRIRVVLRNP